ncbi:succinylglutamate desuccinylase/aspartoacylase [Luminiphilus syltensis NOR5-1B]|uniref:Succinylglutamate desuccinylase/aspartoacylase n=1 Tax=Luminiphilus syltensis NOR5-1B TaxID=565045 RepID=B8KWA4_9GAMM|nr:succinylglutamate desuccinylase/aspartoacylase family protein [Luminiphilus syltensis]EED36506.1 succinylglutamate desuccinylase/aspartoacylase [Luminiphilus syltensis NOR5-1B]
MTGSRAKPSVGPLTIGNTEIQPGETQTVQIGLPPTFSSDDLSMDVHVTRGVREGPTLFVCAAIHGDEINGIEIVRRVLRHIDPRRLSGTLLVIPIVNLYGFNNQTRYLPDGRDLNRSFPGSPNGSLTARLADTFLNEVVSKCTHGIDLHTGGRHRSNFPQIRAQLDNEVVRGMTRAFGAPLVINSQERDGSLRQCATAMGVPVILYESCEALRFDEVYIRAGEKGVLDVMRHLGMLRKTRSKAKQAPIVSKESRWVRAPSSGVHRVLVALGAQVERDQVIGVVAEPLGENEVEVRAPVAGIIIGRSNLPLVYSGDALFHIARVSSSTEFEYEDYHEDLLSSDYNHPEDEPSSAPIVG